MPSLILALPATLPAAGWELDYVLTQDGAQVHSSGRAAAALLPAPARGTEVVAVLPAARLSWHAVALPERVLRGLLGGRMEPARARSVLCGVLEDRLLDDAAQLHFAVFAHPDGPDQAWVAVCERDWLQACLQALEAGGHAPARWVAEATPGVPGAALALLGDALQPAELLLCTEHGVGRLPLQAGALALARAGAGLLQVRAEPSVMALAEQHFGSAATTLQTRAERLLQAAQSPWNLAQLEFSPGRSGRWRKRLQSGWQQALHAPEWRPARWALAGLLAVQLLALNAQAWRERSLQALQREQIETLLRQTFPEVQLVLDAPTQMQRAVDQLAQARGASGGADLRGLLARLAATPGLELRGIDWDAGQLQAQATGSAAPEAVSAALAQAGLRAQWQGMQLRVQAGELR